LFTTKKKGEINGFKCGWNQDDLQHDWIKYFEIRRVSVYLDFVSQLELMLLEEAAQRREW
jgi:hypothetical protein